MLVKTLSIKGKVIYLDQPLTIAWLNLSSNSYFFIFKATKTFARTCFSFRV